MGGSVGTPRSPANQASPEYFAFKVLQGEYDRAKDMENSAMDDWSCSNTIPTDEPYYYQRMSTIYDTALKEFGKPIFECKCPAVILYLYFKLTKEEKEEFPKYRAQCFCDPLGCLNRCEKINIFL